MSVILQLIGLLSIVVSGMSLMLMLILAFSVFYVERGFIRNVCISVFVLLSCGFVANYVLGQSAISSASEYDMSYTESLLVLLSTIITVGAGGYLIYICYQAFKSKKMK